MTAYLKSWPFSRIISALLILSFLNLMQACYYYKVVQTDQPHEPTLANLASEHNFFIIHSGDKVWHMYNIALEKDILKGTIEELKDHELYKTTVPGNKNRYRKNIKNNESAVLDEVHIYSADVSDTTGYNIKIPLAGINKIEVYDPAVGATTASWVFTGLGITASVAGVVLIIILLTKSSCPFVYSYDGAGYAFTGEIFSGATQSGVEREDYLPLPGLVDRDGLYNLKIANKVYEIQHIDLAELLVVDHNRDLSVLTDKYGTVHTFGKVTPPLEAKNASGADILSLVDSKDALFYAGDEKSNDNKGLEEITLNFLRPEGADSAKLIIRAKNDFWLDIMVTKFHAMFGDRYDKFSQKQENVPGEELQQWMSDQHIPLTMYLEKDGKWVFADYFNIAGPMAFKDDILAFGLDGIDDDTLKVKLDFGFLFWDVDYAAIDYSSDATVDVFKCPVKMATDENGTDKTSLLMSADQGYYDQEEVGNEVILSFEKPSLSGKSRTIMLHTEGYYSILRDQQGKPQIKALKEFRNPGRFPEYSRQMFDKAMAGQDYLSGK